MKKSQITIFLFISILLLAAFLTIFAFARSVAQSKSSNQADVIFSDTASKVSLSRYMENCISETANEAVFKIGRQGGFYFKEDKGSIINWDIPYVLFNGNKVAYQIYSPSKNMVSSDYLYPCYTEKAYVPPIMKSQYCYENYNHQQSFYMIGTTGDPVKGINPDLCEAYNYSRSGYSCFCEECTGFSIENQIENYIIDNLPLCMNFSEFRDYNITSSNVSIDITIENEGFTVDVDYPIYLNSKSGEVISYARKFSVSVPLRIKKIYETARNVISQETRNISFDSIRDSYKLNIPYFSYDSEIISNNSSYIFIINDTSYSFHGENFIFQFAVQNRQPALDYYTQNSCYADGKYYDVCAVEGQQIMIEPIAYDPDDFSLHYSYSGWKADHDSLWTTTSQNPSMHQEIFPIYYNHWENSPAYLENSRSASYKTNNYDIGAHEVNITVYDQFGLKDSQIINIFIDDMPSAFFVVHSIYTDIPQDFVSSEDPVLLNATYTSDNIGPSSLEYRWEDVTESKEWDYSESNKIIEFPSSVIDSNSFFSDEYDVKNIILKVKTSNALIGQYQKEINKLECLPHRQDSAPYPFQNYNNDPYPNLDSGYNPLFSNHSCCSDGTDGFYYGSVRTGELCYHLVDYGCIFNFDMNDPRYIDPVSVISQSVSKGIIENPLVLDSDNPYNDLFRREIKIYCGSSGNKCDGPIEVSITPEGSCENSCRYQYQINPNVLQEGIGCS